MHLTAHRTEQGTFGAVETGGHRYALSELARALGGDWPSDVASVVRTGRLAALERAIAGAGDGLAGVPPLPDSVEPAPILPRPGSIVAVGLNYEEHAGDLGEARPDEPATFMKPATTVIGPGEEIVLPFQSDRTTGEAELALVVGRRCFEIEPGEAPSAIAGFVPVIDMTAEDVLQRNPRFLTRAKSFDTFLVVGDRMVTTGAVPDVDELVVATLVNGEARRSNRVAAMRFSPWELVAFFSSVATLEPGDLILTGTPGAVVLADGLTVGCRIDGIGTVEAPVRDRKVRGGPPVRRADADRSDRDRSG